MNRGRPTVGKREKEKKREEWRKQKAERQVRRKEERPKLMKGAAGEDPDIAGIVPGPQPPPEDF